MLKISDFYYRPEDRRGSKSLKDAVSFHAHTQDVYPYIGVDLSHIDIHRGDEHASMLKCLEVLSNVVSGDDRLITMKVKQGHFELRLVAPTQEDLPIFKMTWCRQGELVIEYI